MSLGEERSRRCCGPLAIMDNLNPPSPSSLQMQPVDLGRRCPAPLSPGGCPITWNGLLKWLITTNTADCSSVPNQWHCGNALLRKKS